MDPLEKAKEIWHTFFKMPEHSFVTAKESTLVLIETHIKESLYANQLEAHTYWQKVKRAAKTL